MITLHWDSIDKGTRQQLLSDACLQERLQHYEWNELDPYLISILKDTIKRRSKGTVTVAN